MPLPDVPHRTHVERLFHQALDLPPEERPSFLQAHSPTDAIRREVEALLDGYEAPDSFLEQPAAAHLADALAAQAETRLGSEVGPYRLMDVLGAGGMGVVYRAVRTDGQYEHEVAIKIVRPGVAAQDVRPRFRQERQILARLDHPGIARILDGGVTPDDRPYVVMEYVDGQPIDAYCDTRRLSIDERLRLFRQVCTAVHYAHRHLVVHRDLKPSNILVTEDGTVQLVDFGIAKLLEPDETTPTLTLPHLPRMTPEYAAPEQVHGEAVSTAADVYTLGVLLYVLLTGQRPYRFERRTLEHVAHVLRTTPPARPSGTAPLDAVAAARRTSPTALKRRLRGDLDAIVLKALRKEPEARYVSAEHLAADVERHLEGLPVLARQDTLGYRARRFVRRHHTAVIAGVVALLALGSGLAVALWQAGIARQESRQATAVKDFLIEMVSASDLQNQDRITLTVDTMVARGAAAVDSQFADQPDVREELHHLFGRLYYQLGVYEEATPHLHRALALRLRLGADLKVAETLHQLGLLHHQRAQGDSARTYLEAALQLRREHLPEEAPEVSQSLNALGVTLGDSAYLHEALALRREHLGRSHQLATTLNNVALNQAAQGHFDEARALYEEAWSIYRELFGDRHQRIGMVLHNLALVEMEQGHPAMAEQHLTDGLAMWQAWYGAEHPAAAFFLTSLGAAAYRQDALDRAETHYTDAIAHAEETLGDTHPRTMLARVGQARVWAAQGRLEQAETAIEAMLARADRYHAYVGLARATLGRIRLRQGRPAEARALLEQAERELLTHSTPRHWEVRRLRRDLAATR